MGIGIVLLLWAVVGTVVAAIGAVTLGWITAVLTRRIANNRRKVIVAASLFPLVCLGWGGAMFVFQAVVNEGLLHRDLGLGDTWHAPLPNGYQIMMIDVTDQGWVYNPKTNRVLALENKRTRSQECGMYKWWAATSLERVTVKPSSTWAKTRIKSMPTSCWTHS